MAIFDRMDRMVNKVVDRAFANGFVMYPKKSSPNGHPGPDPDRQVWEGRGILEMAPAHGAIETGNRDGSGNDVKTMFFGTKFQLSIDAHAYPMAKDARQRDRVDTDDGRTFDVIAVQSDGLSRVVLRLVNVGQRW